MASWRLALEMFHSIQPLLARITNVLRARCCQSHEHVQTPVEVRPATHAYNTRQSTRVYYLGSTIWLSGCDTTGISSPDPSSDATQPLWPPIMCVGGTMGAYKPSVTYLPAYLYFLINCWLLNVPLSSANPSREWSPIRANNFTWCILYQQIIVLLSEVVDVMNFFDLLYL